MQSILEHPGKIMRLQGITIRLTLQHGVLLLAGMLLMNLVLVIFWKRDSVQREAELDQAVLARVQQRLSVVDEIVVPEGVALSFAEFYPSRETGQLSLCRPSGCPTGSMAPSLLVSVATEALAGRSASRSSSSLIDLLHLRPPVLASAQPIVRHGRTMGAIAVVRSLKPVFIALWRAEQVVLTYAFLNLLLLGAIGFFRTTQLIVRPIERLVQLADQHARQASAWFVAEDSGSEFSQLASSLNSMLARIEADQASLQAVVSKLESANRQLLERQQETVRAEKLAAVGRMAAGLAHEIGNPLGVVQGYLDLLAQSEGQDEESKDFIRRADQELQRVSRLVRQLLDCARASKGRPEIFSLHGLVHAAAEMLRVQPAFRNVSLIVRTEAEQDLVHADQDHLRQVLVNCLLNSVDAIGSSKQIGGGRISMATDMPTLGTIRIRITDNGSGIAEEHLAAVFDPFYTTKEPGKGTGLGLSVSRSLVETAGGTMKMESWPDQGSTMSICLPLVEQGKEHA